MLRKKHKGRPLLESPLAQSFWVGNLFNVVEIAQITLESEASGGLDQSVPRFVHALRHRGEG